eukprot:s22_g3.t1
MVDWRKTLLVEETSPTTQEEWRTCVHAVEAAKNRLYNRSGYSPGCNIRLPGSLGSDDPYDPQLIAHSAGDEVRRMLQIRYTAMEAFLKQTAREVVQRSELARSRPQITFNVGDVVYVYRVPLRRRGDREGRRRKWVGPGTILMLEGANVWLNMRGELWKCAREQVRKATSEEQQAADMLQEEFAELKEQLRRRGSKRNFQDISGWGLPPADDDPPAPQPPHNRPRRAEQEPEPQQTQQALAAAAVPIEEESSSSSSGSTSTSELEGEGRPEHLDEAVQSVRRPEELDGTRSRQAGNQGLYEPTRRHLQRQQARWMPYREGVTLGDEEEDENAMVCDGVEEGEMGRKDEAPIMRWWTGFTEFTLRRKAPEVSPMVKRGSDEVLEKDIVGDEEWEKWKVADGAHWVKGAPPSRKSRWCVRGDTDPDLLDLERHAPTVTTATLSIVLQICASYGWLAAVGDLKNAFMQSDRLVRSSGRLFCEQPSDHLACPVCQQIS